MLNKLVVFGGVLSVLLLFSVMFSSARSTEPVTAHCLNNQFCYLITERGCIISYRSQEAAAKIHKTYLIPHECEVMPSEDMGDYISQLREVIMIQDSCKGMQIDLSAGHKGGTTTVTGGVSGDNKNGSVTGGVSGSLTSTPGQKPQGEVKGEIHIKI